MRSPAPLCQLLLLCCLGNCPCFAEGVWPAFRGPRGNGHAVGANLPTEWSETRNVVWKRPLPGEGWSSPVIADGRIFLTAAVPKENSGEGDLSLRLIVLSEADGELITDVEVFHQRGSEAPRIHEKNSHASPTPIVESERIYVHFGHQGTACLDLAGGALWKKRVRYQPVHGNGGSPVIWGDALIFSCDGAEKSFVIALDKRNGEELWKTERQTDAERTFSFSTPALIEVAGRTQVISPGSNTVDALDAANGQIIWSVRYDGYSLIPKPVYDHGLLFVCTGYDRPELLAIRPTGRGDVTDSHIAWRRRRNIPHTPSLLVVGDDLFMVSDRGIATCLAAKTGRQRWQQRLPGEYSASPLYDGEKIYLLNETGTATVIRPGHVFWQLAQSQVDERTLASLAASGGRLYLRGDSHLYCFETLE